MITGGDRPEVQTAALEASGIEALVLTGGFRPPRAVLGKAEEEGVPVLLVQSDTRTTIDRVEELLRSGRSAARTPSTGWRRSSRRASTSRPYSIRTNRPVQAP